MAARQYMIVLTTVRPLGPGDPPRDEQTCPEEKREVVGPADYDAAQRIFTAFCSLPQVKMGRQRAKIVPLAGRDTSLERWCAPLVRPAMPNLVGVER